VHAKTNELLTEHFMFSGGRHSKVVSLGKDLVLVHPRLGVPVGLLPDFLHFRRTDEEIVERMRTLYYDVAVGITPSGVARIHIPLDVISASSEG
jgi:hypothetical protein